MSIIVVGSGIGGLSAAEELVKAGRQVMVLEANNVVGGRLATQNVNVGGSNFAFDLGASWIHGSCAAHPITQMSKEVQGLKTLITDDDKMIVYNSKGEDVSQEAEKAYETYDEAFGQVGDQAQDYESIEDVVKRISAESLNDPMIMYHVANDVEFQTSGSIATLSAKLGGDDEEFEGDEELIVSGYQKFCQHIVDKYKIPVHLGHKVTEATYDSQEGRTTIKCQNGKTFQAQQVIWNVPIGVLKSGAIHFEPALPEDKTSAIQGIGFGNVCKILVVFNKMPYTNKQHYIGVVADNPSERGLFTYFLNIYGLAGLPAVMTFGLGANADQAETMSEAQAKQVIASRINVFAQTQIGPNDFKIYRTNWKTNQNFLGAYAYNHKNTKEDSWSEMAKPVFQTDWYFCGEHTTQKYRGTVHGARMSGIEAAKTIINEVKEDNWEYFDDREVEQAEEAEEREEAPEVGNRRPRKGPIVHGGDKRKPPMVKASNHMGATNIPGKNGEACCSVM